MELQRFLLEEIFIRVYRYQNNWQGRLLPIIAALKELDPDKPTDDTTGFLAFNVPGKDRMKLKTGKFLTRKLCLNSGFLPDIASQELANTMNAELFPDIETELCVGQKITDNYRHAVGGRSCMTGNNCDCVRLYEQNPERFRQLVMSYENDSARAIVHKLDNDLFVMDRIYSDSEFLKNRMRDYADAQGWFYRDNGNTREYIISGLKYTDGCVPYMDTFTQYQIDRNHLTIFHPDAPLSADGDLVMTDGWLDNRQCCTNCDCHIHEDEVYWANDEPYCPDCFSENFTFCEHCGGEILHEDAIFVEDIGADYCGHCASRCNVIQCEDCGRYFRNDYTSVEDDRIVCDSCAENYPCCDDCGERFHEINENGYCENCALDHEDEDLDEDEKLSHDERISHLPIACKPEDTPLLPLQFEDHV